HTTPQWQNHSCRLTPQSLMLHMHVWIHFSKCLLDGNLLQTKIHNIGATLVGVDKFGNKYYEKLHDTQYGRHRWVEYAEKGRYNASQLLNQKTARYLVEHKQNYSGEGEELIYHSKGHTLNPGQRDWTRYHRAE
ncbi:unnamed protein product, partial [Miscanthus lutarioriparius]